MTPEAEAESELEAHNGPAEPSWTDVVERIRAHNPSGMEDLWHVFNTGVRFYLCRQLPAQDLDDKLHEMFVMVTQSIQNGDVREPERLMGYVRTVVRRQLAGHIATLVRARQALATLDPGGLVTDHTPDPERGMIERENTEIAMRILRGLNRRDREVLVRFYLKEQGQQDICREMSLSETQFRVIKSRAKARFGELGRTRFSLRKGFQT